MPIETELKLLFEKAEQQILICQLDKLEHAKPQVLKQVSSTYFDTADLQLRHWDMGLRLRTVGEYREQTIKTAGQVNNGLHSRPEYNTEIDADFPRLDLFPAEIWPKGTDIVALQTSLYPLFDTHFSRRCWEVNTGVSLIEIALDVGEICANSHTLPICELELELLEGSEQCLFDFAEQIGKWLPVNPGQASKAQRGYQLAALRN